MKIIETGHGYTLVDEHHISDRLFKKVNEIMLEDYTQEDKKELEEEAREICEMSGLIYSWEEAWKREVFRVCVDILPYLSCNCGDIKEAYKDYMY